MTTGPFDNSEFETSGLPFDSGTLEGVNSDRNNPSFVEVVMTLHSILV